MRCRHEGAGQGAGDGQMPHRHRRAGSGRGARDLRLRGRARRRRWAHRACPQGLAQRPLAAPEPRCAPARPWPRPSAQSCPSGPRGGAQRRHREPGGGGRAPRSGRRRDDGARRLSGAVAAPRGRPALVRRARAVGCRQGGCRCAHPLYRTRARARHATLRHHPPHAGTVPRRAGGARLPPSPGHAGGKVRRRSGGSRGGARAGRRPHRRTGDRRGLSIFAARVSSHLEYFRTSSILGPQSRHASSTFTLHLGKLAERSMFGVPVDELAWLVLLIVAGGVVTGILAGLFGIGGGGIIVPILYEVFGALGVAADVRLQLCVGTSILIIVPTNIRSFMTHRRKGAVMMDVVRVWAIPAVLGVALGAAIAAFAPGTVLKIAFVVVASTISCKLLFGRDSWRLGTALPGRVGMMIYGF